MGAHGNKVPISHLRSGAELEGLRWHEYAACNRPDIDPNMFAEEVDPDTGERKNLRKRNPLTIQRVQDAIAVCGRCPVMRLCRLQAARDHAAGGVWGGLYWTSGTHRALRARVLAEYGLGEQAS